MPRPKTFDPDAAIDAAVEVFWSKGYPGTTPQDLVDALGIGRGSLYNAFASKHDLYRLALTRYVEQGAARVLPILESDGSARERLRAALMFNAEPGRRGCLVTNAVVESGGRDKEVDRIVRRVFERQHQAFRAVVDEGRRSGEFDRAVDPDAHAEFLLAVGNGMRVLAKAGRDPAIVVEVALRAL
ncbi:MAG: TetR/AcrR family transcriptional regulator [Sciscionella sp.]|nr:TetR/AcrR family transcriptional regulator [Sciscionella sp.]